MSNIYNIVHAGVIFFRASRRSLPASRLLLLALKTRKMNGGSAGYSFFPHPGKLLGISSQRLLVVSLQVVSRHIEVVPRKSLLVSIKKRVSAMLLTIHNIYAEVCIHCVVYSIPVFFPSYRYSFLGWGQFYKTFTSKQRLHL